LGEADGALDDQAEVGDPLAEILQGSAFRGVTMHLIDPGLDRAVARPGRELDLLSEAHLESPERGGIQAEHETVIRIRGCGRGGGGRGLESVTPERGSGQKRSLGERSAAGERFRRRIHESKIWNKAGKAIADLHRGASEGFSHVAESWRFISAGQAGSWGWRSQF
jgi:hypothetical protein